MAVALLRTAIARVQCVSGTAACLTSQVEGVPPALLRNLKHNRVLHARAVPLRVETALTPSVPVAQRFKTQALGDGIERVVLRFGFMETPDVPAALALLPEPPPAMDTSFVLSQTILPSAHPGMARWREHLFAALSRTAETPMTAYRLPFNRVMELGSQVEI